MNSYVVRAYLALIAGLVFMVLAVAKMDGAFAAAAASAFLVAGTNAQLGER